MLSVVIFIVPTFIGFEAFAHVPYLEHQDYTETEPFQVRKSIEQSIAVYAWLENDRINPCKDIDVYTFEIADPTRVYIEAIVPVCPEYEKFVPWFALVGPGLPEPEHKLPFTIPEKYGVVVKENVKPGEPREKFYEPFGGKWYYEGPVFDETVDEPGIYYVYYWDPYEKSGDYVAVLGYKERFGPLDILRALIYTPMIRLNIELHVECPQMSFFFAQHRFSPFFYYDYSY